MFGELDIVLVRALRSAVREVDGTPGVVRQPRVGDQGTIVHVLAPDRYIVESVDDAGHTLWLADFDTDELVKPMVDWQFSADEISAGVYRAVGVGPGGRCVEAVDSDVDRAMATCRELALRHL